MTTRLYTRGGDTGETGLLGGQRVAKHDCRVEAVGAVDELNASLGVVSAHLHSANLPHPLAPALAQLWQQAIEMLNTTQAWLFDLGAALAAPPGYASSMLLAGSQRLQQAVPQMENCIDAVTAVLPPLKNFILPGGSPLAAYLHVSRGVCRHAERRVVQLARLRADVEQVAPHNLVVLNRLADLLFILARLANHVQHIEDIPWRPSSS